jgi:TatD DNase family protein
MIGVSESTYPHANSSFMGSPKPVDDSPTPRKRNMTVSLIDTHCHLNFHSYDEDRDAVMVRAAEAGVTRIVNPGIDINTSQEALQLAGRFPEIYAAVGVHPNSTSEFDDATVEVIAALAAQPKVVAIGEIGLDYYWEKSPKAKQKAAFEAQLALAARLELPVIIHNREAGEDVIAILETWARNLPPVLPGRAGVLHSFSAPSAVAKRALAIGFCLGFTGPITYKNADELRRIAVSVPADRIVVETDGPFLTPAPLPRKNRNEPSNIPLIVDRLATLKQVSNTEMGRMTTENAVRLFRLGNETAPF